MKRYGLWFASALLVAGWVVPSVHAGEGAIQQLGVFGAYQDAGDLDQGLGGGAHCTFLFLEVAPGLDLGFDARGTWLTFDGEDNDFQADVDMIPVEGSVVALYSIREGTRPFIGAGAGYYFFDSDEIDIDDEVGFFARAGLEQQLSANLSLFAEAKYLWLEPEVEGFSGDEIDLNGLGANAGLSFSW